MSRMIKTVTAVSAALLVSAAVTFTVRAQDPVPAPVEGAAAATPAAPAAEPARDPNAVVARAGDATVTEGEVALAEEAFSNELANVPQEQRRSVLVDAVLNMELMAQGARDAGLDKGPEFDRRLDFLRLQALRNVYVEHEVVKELTDAELQETYKTLVLAEHKPEQQVHARHILVDTKEAAEKIIADLKGGAAFEELAKQSKDPSGQNGGDLGFFGAGQMVPPFEAAAFALEPGQVTQEPVQSEYGWHVIKVEEKRMSEPPPFAEVEEQLRSYVLRQKFEQVMTGLRDKYPVEILDPTALPAPEPAAPVEGEAAPAVEEPAPAVEEPATEPAPAN
jgi:peptidyl-prolyl cis-trans isomerase C